MDDGMRAGLAEIEAKLELLRRTEAEHGFGVTIDAPGELEDIPALPEGVTEVYRLFSCLAGDYFCFRQPEVVQSPGAWKWRGTNRDCPLGDPLEIGWERYGVPAGLLGEIDGGVAVHLDLADGRVYHVDHDDYLAMYKHEVDEIDSAEFAGDIVAFFNRYVLGAGYPQLVEAVIGGHAVTEVDRQGRHRDCWMRLL
ncbi:hypothetical protein ACN3XK_60520, partial [Actinomadura welshii]